MLILVVCECCFTSQKSDYILTELLGHSIYELTFSKCLLGGEVYSILKMEIAC